MKAGRTKERKNKRKTKNRCKIDWPLGVSHAEEVTSIDLSIGLLQGCQRVIEIGLKTLIVTE